PETGRSWSAQADYRHMRIDALNFLGCRVKNLDILLEIRRDCATRFVSVPHSSLLIAEAEIVRFVQDLDGLNVVSQLGSEPAGGLGVGCRVIRIGVCGITICQDNIHLESSLSSGLNPVLRFGWNLVVARCALELVPGQIIPDPTDTQFRDE